jgi:hypothetical protein
VPDPTIILLTPISIRLSWTGSGDFEVWWKSDHPAGQEYAPLATVTGTSYDVGSLSAGLSGMKYKYSSVAVKRL